MYQKKKYSQIEEEEETYLYNNIKAYMQSSRSTYHTYISLLSKSFGFTEHDAENDAWGDF